LIGSFGKIRKPFFFEKRSKKLFSIWGAGVFTGKDPDDRSFFCFFFVHKKEGSSCRKTTEPIIGSANWYNR